LIRDTSHQEIDDTFDAMTILDSRIAPGTASFTAAPLPTRRADFDLVSLAGRGSFAEVWKVCDLATGESKALKRLRNDCANPAAARRIIENEAEVAHKIDSLYVVKLCDACLDADPPYLVLEWLSGRTLESRLSAQPDMTCREAVWIARQCAQGMQALLVAGYAHGDIKPSNIFLADSGQVKLIDLGFARPDRLRTPEITGVLGSALTGTPEYLAPEALVSGDPGGVARDLYSLGVTLFRMLTGTLPFSGESVSDVLRQHQQAVAPHLRSLVPGVPREVSEFVHRLLAKQPVRRAGGLSWLVHDLIALELLLLASESDLPQSVNRIAV
jgi:serine/threonine-protein kinase